MTTSWAAASASSCMHTMALAPISAVRKPRCWSRWKARGPTSLQAAIPSQLGCLHGKPYDHQQHRDFAQFPGSFAQWRSGLISNAASPITVAPVLAGLAVTCGPCPATMKCLWARLQQAAAARRRCAHGSQAQGGDPWWLLVAVLPADIIMDCTMDYDSISKAGSMLGSGCCRS